MQHNDDSRQIIKIPSYAWNTIRWGLQAGFGPPRLNMFDSESETRNKNNSQPFIVLISSHYLV